MDFIEQVNDRAQEAFRAMLRARDQAGQWTQPEVDAYLAEEARWRAVEERFWKRVDRSDPEGCWPWTGQRHPRGYGFMQVDFRRIPATHLSLAFAGTPVPEGLFALHHCDNPPCVNPSHLFIGTLRDNVRDMVAKGRNRPWLRERTHCKHGHEYSATNTRMDGTRRVCVECARRRSRATNRVVVTCRCGRVLKKGSLRLHRLGSFHRAWVDESENAKANLDWERQRAEFDRLQAADHDMHYFPDPTCGECRDA